MYEESPKVRVGTVKCAYYMPLEKANEGPARGDEVAIFVLNPRQAMYLARGTLYSRGGICYGMTGPARASSPGRSVPVSPCIPSAASAPASS